MEVGKIYKIRLKKEDIVGIVVVKDDIEKYYKVFTTDGEELRIHMEDEWTYGVTKMKPELRGALKEAAKRYAVVEKIQQEITKLRSQFYTEDNLVEEAKSKIKEAAGLVDIKKIIKSIPYANQTGKNSFSFDLVSFSQKYATPELYSFLYREYDNNVMMEDEKKAINLYGLKMNSDDINQLGKQLKHMVIKEVFDYADVGGKSTLTVGKTFELEIKRGATSAEIIKDIGMLNKWIKIQVNLHGLI